MKLTRILSLLVFALLMACGGDEKKELPANDQFIEPGEPGCHQASIPANAVAVFEHGEGNVGFSKYTILDDGSVTLDTDEGQETYTVEDGTAAVAALLVDLEATGIDDEAPGCYTCETDDDPFIGYFSYRTNDSISSFNWLYECGHPEAALGGVSTVIRAYFDTAKAAAPTE